MTEYHQADLHQAWEKRWQGQAEAEKLTPWGRRMFLAKLRAIREELARLTVGSVIEVGCGLGHTLALWPEAGLDYLGIDISPSAVAVCQKQGLRAEQRAVEDQTGRFDLVFSDGMLEHFLNFEPMARELGRLAGRYVMLIQPNHHSFWGRTAAFLSETLGAGNVLEYNYRIDDFIDVFAAGGFRASVNRPIFADIFRLLVFERSNAVPETEMSS